MKYVIVWPDDTRIDVRPVVFHTMIENDPEITLTVKGDVTEIRDARQ